MTTTDGLGRTSTITYDPNTLMLTRITGPACKCAGDQTRTYTYDANHRPTNQSDDAVDGTTKHTLTYTYTRDSNGRTYPGPTSIVENLDTAGTTRTTTIAYYALGDTRQDLPQTTTLPSVDHPGNSMTVTDTYSTTGLLTQRTTTGYVNGAATSYTQRWSYDTRGRVLTKTGPRTDVNQTTTYTYFPDNAADATQAGQLNRITDALGHATQLSAVSGFTSYTPFGDPQSTTDPNGVQTQIAYDARGRVLTNTMLPASESDVPLITQTVYDAAGRRTQQIRPAKNYTTFTYDTSGRSGAGQALRRMHMARHEQAVGNLRRVGSAERRSSAQFCQDAVAVMPVDDSRGVRRTRVLRRRPRT